MLQLHQAIRRCIECSFVCPTIVDDSVNYAAGLKFNYFLCGSTKFLDS